MEQKGFKFGTLMWDASISSSSLTCSLASTFKSIYLICMEDKENEVGEKKKAKDGGREREREKEKREKLEVSIY